MADHQYNLFAAFHPPAPAGAPTPSRQAADPGPMTGAELVDAVSRSRMADAIAAMAEAGRRRLAAAVPALAAVCRRYRGYGHDRAVPEQAAALDAIGGREAAAAVAAVIVRGDVQGPTMVSAIGAAARLGVSLPTSVAIKLLRHDNPAIRADASRCVRNPAAAWAVVDLLSHPPRRRMRHHHL